MLQAGVSGYLSKDCSVKELTRAIRTVMRNQVYVSPNIATIVVKDYIKNLPVSVPTAAPTLSSREREVLQLLSEGKSTKEISLILNLSMKTVASHRFQIMEKLGIHNIAELTKFAVREGLTDLDS